MMYTSLKFESGEAARSQVEPLQIQTRLILGHENCSNGGQKYMCRGFSMNRRYDKYGRYCCNRPENGSKQSMQKPIKCIASDPQCLQLVTGTCASVASCLNTIGRNVACFTRLLADGFARDIHCRAQWFVGLITLQQKSCLCNVLEHSHRRPSCSSINRGDRNRNADNFQRFI